MLSIGKMNTSVESTERTLNGIYERAGLPRNTHREMLASAALSFGVTVIYTGSPQIGLVYAGVSAMACLIGAGTTSIAKEVFKIEEMKLNHYILKTMGDLFLTRIALGSVSYAPFGVIVSTAKLVLARIFLQYCFPLNSKVNQQIEHESKFLKAPLIPILP